MSGVRCVPSRFQKQTVMGAVPPPKISQEARNVHEVCDYDDLLAFRSKFRLKKANTDFKRKKSTEHQ